MRKFPKIFVFLFFFYSSQAQYSLPSIELEKEYEYDQRLSLKQYLLFHPEGSEQFPLLVTNFLNCNDISSLESLEIYTIEGELVYRSGHPSENINLKNIPVNLYKLNIKFNKGYQKEIFFRRVD